MDLEGVNSKFAALDMLDVEVEDTIKSDLNNPGDPFTSLPPEMIKAILEHLVADPRDLMRCRLVCHILKDQVDSMLESNIISVWNWDPLFHTKDKPPYRSRLRTPLPSGPVFQTTQKLNRFILDIERLPVTSNPFPNRSIFFRRVRKSNSVPNHLYSQANRYLDYSTCRDHWGSQDDPNLLSLSSTYHLLKKFGGHLTSLIFESGPTVTLPSIVAFHSILHNLPNLRCLMFRTTWIDMTNPIPGLDQENILLPPLPQLESLKILYCDRFITESLLRNYGGLSLPITKEKGSVPKSMRSKVTKVQVIARDICWINYLKNVVHNENGISGENAFPQLEEFKLGNISTVPSFSLLETIFQRKIWPCLQKLSLQFSGDSPGFKIPAKRLLSSVLNNFPKLREFYFDVLECSQGSILLDPVTSDLTTEEIVESSFPKKGSFGILRLTCPAFLLDSPWFVTLVTQKMRSLQILQFRIIDQWLMTCGDLKRAADPVNYDLQLKFNYNYKYDLLPGAESSGRTLLLMAQSRPELVEFRVVMETFWKQLPALRQINVFPADDNRDFEAFQSIDALHECIMSAHKLNKLQRMNIKV